MNRQEEFIEKHKNSQFHHKDELFTGLSSGKCVLESYVDSHQSSLPCSHFLRIYRIRAEHCQFNTSYAQRLREDTLALCAELAKTPDEICCMWEFSMPPYASFTVFEGAASNRILGCIFAIDQRLMPPDEWERLWHGENGMS